MNELRERPWLAAIALTVPEQSRVETDRDVGLDALCRMSFPVGAILP
jgi:hypothetical protein